MECTKAKWRRLDLIPPDQVPDGLPGADQSSQQASTESEGKCIHPGFEGQRHPHRGQQMAVPHLEFRSQSPPVESEDSANFRRGIHDPAEDSPIGIEFN